MSDSDPVALKLATFATDFSLDHAPVEVVDRIKRYLADTLACAAGGSFEQNTTTFKSVYEHAVRFAAIPDSTIIGTDDRVERRAAALVNCTLARHLDANDIYMGEPGRFAGSGHFSDVLPAVVSVAESCGADGRGLLEAAIVAYEIQGALADAYLWMDQGLHTVSQVSIASAASTSRLLGSSVNESANAIAMAISTGIILQTWLKPSVAVPSIKSSAAGIAAERGVMCAELAAQGATGPLDAFETMAVQWPADLRIDTFDRLGRQWSTPRNAMKAAPAQIFTQPVIQCAADLYKQGLRLDAMKSLTVRSNNGACARVQGSPGSFRPETREAADHSTPFVVAMTLLDGQLSLASYENSQWFDPEIRSAMDRMSLVVDPQWDARFDAGQFGAEIQALGEDGTRYEATVEQFAGHPDNPLTDDQLIAKMSGLMEGESRYPLGSAQRLFDACVDLESQSSIRHLIDAVRSPVRMRCSQCCLGMVSRRVR